MMKKLIDRLASVGNLPEDSEETKLHKRFLIYMALLMSGGGLLWGTICVVFGVYFPATIPYGYTLITVFNLLFFSATKRFRAVRFVQVLMSLLLPFLFQWSLGGFVVSGAVMLWALVALVGSVSFQSVRLAARWLLAYVVLTIVSGLIDSHLSFLRILVPSHVTVLFFVINIVAMSSIVAGLMLYFVNQRDLANGKLLRLKEELEVIVQNRTVELSEALAHLTAIVDNIADGLVVTNDQGVVTRINPSLRRMFSTNGDDPLTKHVGELAPDIGDLVTNSCHTRGMSSAEVPLTGGRTGKAVTNPINQDYYDEAEKRRKRQCIGSVTVIRDITREKEIDAMKTDFISNVSHELRTPLTSVLGFAKIIGKKLDDSIFPKLDLEEQKLRRAVDQVRGNINIIVSEGERLTSLINDVLDISKMEAGKIEWNFQPNQLGDILNHAVEATSGLFASNERVSLVKEIAPDLPVIELDRHRIIQVVVNLISNASKFTKEGSVTVRAEKRREEILVGITDTGMGIRPEHQDNIFEKFKQVGDTLTDKPTGTGLGLPICRQIVESHGGRIWVESEFGKGSTFFFTLPLSRNAAGAKERLFEIRDLDTLVKNLKRRVVEDTSLAPTGARKTVLVVDDDPNIRALLRQELEDDGYQVAEAESGTVALDYLKEHRPHLVILDIMMPGMNGLDVAAIIKNNPETMYIPIMIHSILEDHERGYRLGVDKYVTKSTNTQQLMREVSDLIEQGASRKKVLVIDENETTAQSLVEVLSTKGYEATGAYDGKEGIQKAIVEKPDMIIMDSLTSERNNIMQTLRFEKGLENLYFIILGESNKHEEDKPEATSQR